MTEFFDSRHMALVERKRFKVTLHGEKLQAFRSVIVISTFGLGRAEISALEKKYLAEFGSSFISFPLKERAKHLITRIDGNLYNFGRAVVDWLPRFRVKKYSAPRERTLEVMLRLEPGEIEKLRLYLQNIRQNRARTIGGFSMAGQQLTTGKLAQNLPLSGGHNCSSWIATAPVGAGGEPLLEILGGSRELEVGTNPGWWASWLSAAGSMERIPFLLHWTPQPLAKALAEIIPGERFLWDFNRH